MEGETIWARASGVNRAVQSRPAKIKAELHVFFMAGQAYRISGRKRSALLL